MPKHAKPVPIHRPWPKFTVPPHPRFGTDEQWAIFERDRAQHFEAMGILLGCMQWVCTRLGNPQRCALRTCRRKGRCAGRRPEHLWNDGFLFPLVPPCEPVDPERVYQLRDEVRQLIWRSAHGHKPNPPPPPARNAATPLVFPDEDMHVTAEGDRTAKGRGGDLPPAGRPAPPRRSVAERRYDRER